MDAGLFLRSKLRLGLWIGVPLALVILLLSSVSTYTRRIESLRKETTSLTGILPEMEARLGSAQALISRFALPSKGGTDVSEIVRRRVTEAAGASRFSIDSLSVTRSAPDASAARIVTASVAGGGGLEELISFLNQAQGGEHLVVVESAVVRASPLIADTMYSADLVLSYYVLGP